MRMRYTRNTSVTIHEHNPKIDGGFQNWITCLQGAVDEGEVVCCLKLGTRSRYFAGYCTLVDCTEWTDKRGAKHQYEMSFMHMKLNSLKKLRRKKDDRGTMVGTMWAFTREGEQSAGCGDDWEYKRDVDMEKLFAFTSYRGKRLTDIWAEAESNPEAMARVQRAFQIKPDENGKLPLVIPAFNYFELLKPKSPKELRILLGNAEVGATQASSTGGSGGTPATGGVDEDQIPF